MGRTEKILSQRTISGAALMIFVTVGTHEQPFDRLVREIDELKGKGIIQEEIFIQTGYSTHVPRFCRYEKLLSFDNMTTKAREARIVITHGGPGSIMTALYNGKIPIVVPRRKSCAEHVDDHQVRFVKQLEDRGRIIAVYEVEKLRAAIREYDKSIKSLHKTDEYSESLISRVKSICDEIDRLCCA